MLKRFYASNSRTLVNFEISFGDLTLLLGPNGAGKTTVFEAMRLVCELLRGRKTTDELFPYWSFTRWQDVPVQEFELTVGGPSGDFVYRVEIERRAIAS